MRFSELVDQAIEFLQRRERVSYRALKREFDLDDESLEDLRVELIDALRIAADEGGKVLVWTGVPSVPSSQFSVASVPQPPAPQTLNPELRTSQPPTPNPQSLAERRQLTVMFCDLVGSTALSAQLDPEELREVVRNYQETCAGVIRRYDGHIAQHLGDGLLVYFGYPEAHEDDAQRAVRAGLEIVQALQHWVPSPLVGEPSSSPSPWKGEGSMSGASAGEGSVVAQSQDSPHPGPLPKGARGLRVRIGIHTGLVVIGEIGSSKKREMLALGETPNLAARIQGVANPDEVVMSAATYRLVEGLFACEDRGQPELKGIATPLTLYRVVKEGESQSRFQVVVSRGLTPLMGRDHEVGLLQEQWERAKQGEGQVVLLSGEPGIGKSRLGQTLKERVMGEGATRIEFRCSPYHQNSAYYPLLEHLQRFLQFTPQDTPQARLVKLHQTLAQYRFPQADTLPLLATLLSLPQPEGMAPLTLSPQKQKQKTQEALVAWIVEETERAAVYCAWEDLHWIDPSSLDVLTLVLDQTPAARLLVLLTFRPEFTPPWRPHSHITQLTLTRLGRPQVEAMVEQVTGGKILPIEVLQQIVRKTDGVPLFVEELTKTVVESLESVGSIGSLESVEAHGRAPLQFAIPVTLQDSLMARLDRLNTAKESVQVAAMLGREFSYELLHAVSPLAEATLQQGLRQLVEAEVVYQRGLPPQSSYIFKHALIQDAAYQSLLKSRRQQLHQQIAQVLEAQFVETRETQPELLAHHYTEAGLVGQAIPYWQQAGQRAAQRSAYAEAINHLRTGLELLKTLPDTPERAQQELALQMALGASLMAAKGYGAPEVEKAYTRARELCQQVGETPQLISVLGHLSGFYSVRREMQTARELAEQYFGLAQSTHGSTRLTGPHNQLGQTLFFLGEIVPPYDHMLQGIALYDPQKDSPLVSNNVQDNGVSSLCYAARALWCLGYPDQAMRRIHEALTLAQELSHPFSLTYAFCFAALLHQCRREWPAAQEWAERTIALATEQGFPFWLAYVTSVRGCALAEQGEVEEGIAQMRQSRMSDLTPCALAEAYAKVGQVENGLSVLTEVLASVDKPGYVSARPSCGG
jgi:class 3 adenylate cyclase/tetratricopeptide (TPR) repeat protein